MTHETIISYQRQPDGSYNITTNRAEYIGCKIVQKDDGGGQQLQLPLGSQFDVGKRIERGCEQQEAMRAIG